MLPVGGGGGRGVERGGAGGAAARAGAAHLPPPHDVPGGVGRRLPRPLRGLVCVHMSRFIYLISPDSTEVHQGGLLDHIFY